MEIFKLFGSIFVDTEKADESIRKTNDLATKLGKGFLEVVKVGAKVAAGVGAAATAGVAAITAVAENTREYRNEMAKLDTAFQDADFSSKNARDTYKELQKVLGDTGQAVEASNHLAELCDTSEQLATWTDICTGVYAKFGASLPIEGLTEAANETAKVGTLTGALADALNWAGVNEDQFQNSLDKCNSEQERQQLITETLNELYSTSAELYKKNNAEVLNANAAQEKLSEVTARLGEKIEPVVTNLKLFGAMLLEKAIPAITYFVTESEAAELIMSTLKATSGLLEEAYNGLNTMIGNVSEAWNGANEWGKEHETVLSIITIALGTLTAAVIAYNSAKITKKALDIAETIGIYALIVAENAHTIATTAATMATTAFSTVLSFLTSPITLVVLAIGALIAICVALYQNWDVVKAKAIELWEKLTETFENIKNTVHEKVENIKTTFENTINSMKEKASEVFEKIKNTIDEKIQSAKNVVKNGIDFIKGIFDFDWKLPDLKMPHFSISGEFSLNPLQVPSIGVDWYKKAMNAPMILDEPTIFGFNSEGEAMGAGEAGSEVVSGTNTLMNMIGSIMDSRNKALIEVLYMILEAILQMDANMGGNLRKALEGMTWKVDRRAFGRLVNEVI